MSNFIRGDCLEYMRKTPDKLYDLAIVDPPYGDGLRAGEAVKNGETLMPAESRFGGRFDKYKRTADCWTDRRSVGGEVRKKIIAWDAAPGKEYFDELFRISRNQIIWGGNYFGLPPTRCFVVWRKTNIPAKGFTMAPVEYAWTSFNRNAELIEAHSGGNSNYVRFHPTQKPISLYEELLYRFAKKGDKILDTHVGSGSSLIACYNMGYEYTGYEIDETYYSLACKRIAENMAQIRMNLPI